ncbi:hypothetical protein BGZ99_008004 [Dissophora globulifera]|uniref:C2H2-type domain-containing protein n=1 Tax=Dissophora globulifera TaxID=979702 RepID=A0A9P6V0N5_9FUNG|nr:hypothetical protein BGZ99_008004 [Dissophora globulifera]
MTASALASPALSESSVVSAGYHQKAQTNKNHIEQSHEALFLLDTNGAAPSPAASNASFSASPSPSLHSSPHPVHHIFTSAPEHRHQEQHHRLQILGNHPVSPVACTFLDLPEDPFMPARSNILFSDAEYKQEYQEPAYESENFMPYSTEVPTGDDCQPDNSYSQRVKNELSNDQFATLGGVPTSMGSSYMMSMARSFSDSQLSDMCDSPNMMTFDSAAALSSHVSLNQATGAVRDMDLCQSPLGYTASQVVYNDDYYVSAQQHNLYSQQHSQSQYHHHQHNYSTSSLSSISEDSSSVSPRSSFSNSCSMTPSYPLVRTLSEPSLPLFQSMTSSSPTSTSTGAVSVNGSSVSLVISANGTSMIKPTPKRSRGRRVSCNPDNSGCKVFTCWFDDCGKIFKRSEHLKRHVRSIHTMEKPFECPIQNCPKRFSRSDNLNQHIRIHRHNGRGEKNKAFAAFTPFLQSYTNDLLSLS